MIGAALLLNWAAIQVFSVLGTSVIVSVHHISFENSLIILVLSSLVGYCGYLSHGWMGDKIGRRNVIGLGWMLGGLAFAGMLFGPSNMPMVVGLYSLGLFFLIGPYSAALFFISESFPTSIRATGARSSMPWARSARWSQVLVRPKCCPPAATGKPPRCGLAHCRASCLAC